MKILIQILKSIGIWIILTIVALTADSIFRLSDKSEFFTAIFVILPLVVAVWSPSKKLINWAIEYEKSKPNKSQTPKQTPASQEKPDISQKPTKAAFRTTSLSRIDHMEGHDFEYWCADLLRKNGFTRVEVTRGSGDQGVDIIAYKDGKKYAIQCKRYNQKLGNKPIQEVHTGKSIYHCDIAAVMTNNYFTPGAVEAAGAVGVILWDRDALGRMMNSAS